MSMLSLSIVAYIFSGSVILSYHIATADVSTVTSPAYSNFTFNCLEAETHDNDLDFCHMVHWTSSSAFNRSSFSAYYPGEKLAVETQDQRAHDFYDSMYTKNGDSHCRQAVKRLACTMFFPEYVMPLCSCRMTVS